MEEPMKCDHCEKTFRRKVYYELIDGTLHETYCSAECAMKANGIKCASEIPCWECGKPIAEMPYTDESGDLFCSLDCALKANFVDIVGESK